MRSKEYSINRYRTKKVYLEQLWFGILNRLKNRKTYSKRTLHFSKQEFFIFARKSNYSKLYKNWVKNNFSRKFSPTVDRINNLKNYTLKNIQFLTFSENARKGIYERPKASGLTSKYKGVSWYKRYKKWTASIQIAGKSINLGYFTKEKDAAKAYKKQLSILKI